MPLDPAAACTKLPPSAPELCFLTKASSAPARAVIDAWPPRHRIPPPPTSSVLKLPPGCLYFFFFFRPSSAWPLARAPTRHREHEPRSAIAGGSPMRDERRDCDGFAASPRRRCPCASLHPCVRPKHELCPSSSRPPSTFAPLGRPHGAPAATSAPGCRSRGRRPSSRRSRWRTCRMCTHHRGRCRASLRTTSAPSPRGLPQVHEGITADGVGINTG